MIDKRITPRFMKYEKADLLIGIVVVVTGAAAIMGAATAAFAGTKGSGNFTDSAGLAAGLAARAGKGRRGAVRGRTAGRRGNRRVRRIAGHLLRPG